MKKIKKTALVMGFGSAGQKHAMILKKYLNFKKIYIYTSKKKIKNFRIINNLKDIKNYNFEYFVISSETSKHYDCLKYIEDNFRGKKILVEKPLFEKFRKIKIKNNKVFVGYNLRMHPLLKKIKSFLNKKKIYSINVICNSFLPNWRKNIYYKKSSSVSRKKGGGVILDLSHEFDYINWIFGDIKPKFVSINKLSNLTLNTEDSFLLYGKIYNTKLSLDLNYFSRIQKRLIFIDGEKFSATIDIVKGTLKISYNDKISTIRIKEKNKDFTYINLHKKILSSNYSDICDFKNGIKNMKFIEKIKNFH